MRWTGRQTEKPRGKERARETGDWRRGIGRRGRGRRGSG